MILEQIKKKMDEHHISQNEMAYRIDVTPVSMCRWLTGKRHPTVNYLEKMADELGCTLELKEKKNE